jgi:3',5'-cyclic AMP phosphodiesterase CpdA
MPDRNVAEAHRLSRRELLGVVGGAVAAGSLPTFWGRDARAQDERRTASSFRFVFMPDFHLRREFASKEGMVKALQAAMALKPKPAFVVTGGDLCQNLRDQTLDECVEMADLFVELWKKHVDVPAYHGLGNHDPAGWGKGLESFPGGKDHPLFGFNLLKTKLNIPDLQYSFDYGGWHFVILLNITLTTPGEYISEFSDDQLAWLRSDLSKTNGRPTILFGHFPPVTAVEFFNGEAKPEDKGWALSFRRASRNPMALIEAIGDANVKAFFSGHIHRLDRIEVKGQTFICAGSVSGDQWRGPDVDTEEGFGIVDCRSDGGFEYRYHEYGWDARKG